MKKQILAAALLLLALTLPTQAAKRQKPNTPQQLTFQHPWQGKRVAYFGDSITDPNIKASKVKYWGFLQQWLGITPYVYGVSGRQWNDIPRQADKLKAEHGDDFDAILIFMGTNDFNNGVPVGEWYTETFDSVKVARHKPGEWCSAVTATLPWTRTRSRAASTSPCRNSSRCIPTSKSL